MNPCRNFIRVFVIGVMILTVSFISCSEKSKSPTGTNGNDDNQVTFVSIPGGTFQMGDVGGVYDEKPVHSVTLSGFEMSIYEITNAQYCEFLNDVNESGDITVRTTTVPWLITSVVGSGGAYNGMSYISPGYYQENDTINKCWINHNNGSFTVETGKENWPVVFATWYGAKAFALYYGFDLPTEAEWEYACRGGLQYQYGTDDGTISIEKVNYHDTIGHPVDVGSYPANPFGLYDMSGNVYEWCNDRYGTYSSGTVTNPTGAQSGSRRVNRGGSWLTSECRSAFRSKDLQETATNYLGFRVVRRISP